MLHKPIKQGSYIFCCLLFLIFVAGLSSCEFESDDLNYVHVEKPEDQIQLGIDLAGVNPTELIYIYNQTYFTYSLFTDNRVILARQFYLDGVPIETDQYAEGVHLNIPDNQIHDLKLVIALRSGTGSLADKEMYEMYTGEFTFKIKAIPYYNDVSLNISQTTDANNNLKLEWDKPSDFEVDTYRIYNGYSTHGELLATITDQNKTYFVDPDYAYGYKSYTIVANVKNSFDIIVENHFYVSYTAMTENHFDINRIALNTTSLKWNNPNPFPCKYVLTYGYEEKEIALKDGANEAIITVGDFPIWSNPFSLYILPQSADIKNYKQYSSVAGNNSDKRFSALSFDYNFKEKKVHGLNFNALNSYDLQKDQVMSPIVHNLFLHTGCRVKVSKDGVLAIEDIEGFLNIYSDYSLQNKIAKTEGGIHPFYFMDNNKLLIEDGYGFRIYDIAKKKVIASKTWKSSETDYSIAVKTATSANGKYMYVICWDSSVSNPAIQRIELYEITPDNTFKLLDSVSSINVESIYFNPLKNDEAIIKYDSHKEIRFEIVDIFTKETKEIKGLFMNIDSFTGNLLFFGEEFSRDEFVLYIWDKNHSDEEMKINLSYPSSWSDSFLYNNILFYNGYYVNLSNLKEWKQ